MKNILKSLAAAAAGIILCLLLCTAAHAEDTLPTIPISTSPVVSITLQSGPDKTSYFVGESIDVTGAVIRLTHDDGFVETYAVSADWCTDADNYTPGKVNIYVDYPNRQGYTGANPYFTVSFSTPAVSNITIESLPKKTEYYTGDSFESRGISVMAHYTNGETWDVTNEVKYSGFDSSSSGKKTVTVTYTAGGKTVSASFSLTVTQLGIVSARIGKTPDKVDYLEGQELDLTGLEVILSYNDETEITVSDLSEFTSEGYDKNLIGIQTVGIFCRGARVGLSVKVTKSPMHRHTSGELQTVKSSSCAEDGLGYAYCIYCKDIAQTVIYPAIGHSYGDWEITLESSVSGYGQRKRVCSVCGAVDTEAVAPLTDSLSDGEVTASVVSGSYFPMGCVMSSSLFEPGTGSSASEYSVCAEIMSSAFAFIDAGGKQTLTKYIYKLDFTVFGQPADIPGQLRLSVPLPADDGKEYSVYCSSQPCESIYSDGTVLLMPGNPVTSAGIYICVLEILPEETTAELTEALTSEAGQTDSVLTEESTEAPENNSELGRKFGALIIKICLGIAAVAVLSFVITLVVKRNYYKK